MFLILERKGQEDKTGKVAGGRVVVTPPIDEAYWKYRVRVSEEQAVVGFPKFNTIGIGFAVEEDWNTNLPYTCSAEEILSHIEHNRLDASTIDSLKAIQMIQEAIRKDKL